jgi:hypothetical protein
MRELQRMEKEIHSDKIDATTQLFFFPLHCLMAPASMFSSPAHSITYQAGRDLQAKKMPWHTSCQLISVIGRGHRQPLLRKSAANQQTPLPMAT